MIKVKRFTAVWCGPCRQLAPLFEQLQTSFPNVTFETIDVDTSPEEVQQHMVTSVPTVIFEKDGLTKQRFVGAQPKSMYVDTINSLK
jgi:thiol-disulfide isomerase/thioredoxin